MAERTAGDGGECHGCGGDATAVDSATKDYDISMAKIMNMKVRYPWDYEAIHSPQSRAAFKTALAVRSG